MYQSHNDMHICKCVYIKRFPNSKIVIHVLAILEMDVTEAHWRSRLYTEQLQKWLVIVDVSSQSGIGCSHWLIWLLCGEPLTCTMYMCIPAMNNIIHGCAIAYMYASICTYCTLYVYI